MVHGWRRLSAAFLVSVRPVEVSKAVSRACRVNVRSKNFGSSYIKGDLLLVSLGRLRARFGPHS